MFLKYSCLASEALFQSSGRQNTCSAEQRISCRQFSKRQGSATESRHLRSSVKTTDEIQEVSKDHEFVFEVLTVFASRESVELKGAMTIYQ